MIISSMCYYFITRNDVVCQVSIFICNIYKQNVEKE